MEGFKISQITDAVKNSDVSAVQKLIKEGFDVNSRITASGWTALHVAVEHEDVPIALFLLKSGADPNKQDTSGWTALHLAVDIEADGAHQSGSKATPVISEILLRHGAKAGIEDAHGETPTSIARGYDYSAFLKLFGVE